ncbi:SpoIIE family protein phosphatase [candidate division KSB1 bacterium]|nr:SpoIIE family protein phosphatase [candidate division KSB1 bacterium]NIR72994.1 SpoIIE family protein phosphatase [candidate division KSB1 bacterium]NIS27747.1 SpoIIE family protein phosphatase [candidate division KSB1 bacterium]NIT74595.1 SpoIIE family protein phosphatase [candidate division KSB1 bacterium]NIU28414.1 SpoIIE family protein phosphatase [candidate division KSB1 bacterium]
MLRKVEKEQLKVPADVDYLGDLRDFVTQVGKKHGFSDKMINSFKLAIDEAATNIIRYAYRDSEGLITLRTIVRKNSLTLCIIDQGTYFDPKRVKDPDLKRYMDIGKKGGLGIFIMRKLMDEIDYRRTEEGNELRITKYREKEEAKKIKDRVSSMPLPIKANFLVRSFLTITAIISFVYLYYYLKADDRVMAEFVASERTKTNQIVNRIGSALNNDKDYSGFLEPLMHPIYEDYKDQIHRMTIEDSTGMIVYSAVAEDLYSNFERPQEFEEIETNVYKYELEGKKVFEFENAIRTKETGEVFGKAHIYVTAQNTEKQIATIRVNDLKLALLILGASYVGVALLIYLVMNPLRKLSTWIKDLGHGEIDDEIDIDASSEIGEIAQAFSDITHRFRESQKNLADQERIQKEMQVAQDIQQTLLPMEFPEIEGYEIASYYEAAKEVGGDYYDFVEVDKDTLGITIADVSGKGVPGSLVMTMIRTALRTEARGLKDAAEVLCRVNDFVSNDIKKGMFVTVFYLIIDSKKRRINYASAGHNPMILYRASKKNTYYLNPKGFPIGIQLPEDDLFKKSIESETIQLAKDDILLIYTDGITEAMNPNRELFGEERLLKVLREYGHLPTKDFEEQLKNTIYSFTEGSPQYDDISFVAIRETSTREEDEFRRAKEAHKLISDGVSIREACETVNLTTYAYYNKYKKTFEEEGIDAFEIEEEDSVEAKHLSIEEKTKIFDIIANHPEYGASRISDELNTEKYNFTKITESKIYDELVRSRLNTRQLREAFVARGQKSKRKLKPPGTPMLTLDGKVVMERKDESDNRLDSGLKPKGKEPVKREIFSKKKDGSATKQDESRPAENETAAQTKQDAPVPDTDIEASSLLGDSLDEILSDKDDEEFEFEELMSDNSSTDFDSKADLETDENQESTHASVEELMTDSMTEDEFEEDEETTSESEEIETDTVKYEDASQIADFSFEDLFEDSAQLQADEDFEDGDSEESSQEQTVHVVEQNLADDSGKDRESEIDSQEETQESESEDETETELTGTTIDELLAEESQTQFHTDAEPGDEDLEKMEDEDSFSAVEDGQDEHSFADLIQALDDEIVYVNDGFNNNDPASDAPTNKKDRNADKEPRAKVKEQKDYNGRPRKSAHDLNEREHDLIKGIKYYKNKRYDDAIKEFKRVIDRYPDYKEAHSILGNAYFRNGMYDEACRAYEKVKRLDSGDVTAYENMGVIYANRGQYEWAVNEWKKVLELSPDRKDIERKIQKALLMI